MGCALVLLRRIEEGVSFWKTITAAVSADGHLYIRQLAPTAFVGVCKVLQGDISWRNPFSLHDAILQREKEGYRTPADWYRLSLAEVYLQIIAGKEKPPLPILLKNLPILLKVMLTGPSRIRTLMTRVLENPQFRSRRDTI